MDTVKTVINSRKTQVVVACIGVLAGSFLAIRKGEILFFTTSSANAFLLANGLTVRYYERRMGIRN